MAMITLHGDEVVVELSSWEKLGALHSSLRIPRSAIRSVEVSEAPFAPIRGFRAPGTGWPGRIALGTWRRRGAKDFCAAYAGTASVVLELDPAATGFSRVIVSVEDPAPVLALGDEGTRPST